MSSLKLTGMLILFLATARAQTTAQWEQILGSDMDISCMDFVNDSVGWLAGNYGTLLKTENGGESWQSLRLADTLIIHDIEFHDENLGWAVIGNYGETNISITRDGGNSWTNQLVFDGWQPDLQVVSHDRVYIHAGDSIYQTLDGGTRWSNVTPPDFENRRLESMWATGSSFIITGRIHQDEMYRGLIMRSEDDGETWLEFHAPEFSLINGLKMFNDSSGYFIASGYDEYYHFCLTRDTCRTWTSVYFTDIWLWQFFLADDDVIFLFNGLDQITKSVNGGSSWDILYSSFLKITDMAILHEKLLTVGSAAGSWFGPASGSMLLQSTDGGRNWYTNEIMSYQFRDVRFLDENNGYLGGGNFGMHEGEGHLFRTSDGGSTWQPVFGGMSRIVHNMQFFNAQTGFILSRDWYSEVFETTDSGDSWDLIHIQNTWDSLGYRFECGDFYFINEQQGWLAGQHEDQTSRAAAVMATIDGGQSWQLAWKDSSRFSFDDILYTPGGQVWAVGNQGLVVHTGEEGTWQSIRVDTDQQLRDVFFVSDSVGWIAGGYADEWSPSPILLRTSDGGESWEKSELDSFAIHDMYFFDEEHGWAVGQRDEYTGILAETMDGGTTWSLHSGYTGPPLRRIHFLNEYGWIVGGGPDFNYHPSGILLITDDGGTSWIDPSSGRNYPAAFHLEQNYPNPFNAETVISWQAGTNHNSSQHIEISIFNILGQKVATPVSGLYTAGRHQVTWNAADVASGVYYYRMTAKSGFTQTKKLLLLK